MQNFRFSKGVIIFFVGIVFFSCKVKIIPNVIDGSKSDGILVLSYEYNQGLKPVVDWSVAIESATKRCKDWGYSDAKLFETAVKECISEEWDKESCLRWKVTVNCQCID